MAKPVKKPAGIAPLLLREQVRSTAPWAFGTELAAIRVLESAPALEQRWASDGGGEDYFVLLLAAHYLTVGTFCPTDVDARIRLHAWKNLSRERLASAVDRVEEVARWPVPPVSARHVVLDGEVLAGHQGEWFSVLAGALGRALAVGDQAVVDRTTGWIEAELAREARLVTRARKDSPPEELLAVVTTVAHNLGDLSRVVDTWTSGHADSALGLRYRRLGHDDASRFDGAFVYAGERNKEFMALENHRFLPLREPKALRREREFLLPFGPYFHDWGRKIGSTKLLSDEERAEILNALVKVHELRKTEHGCLRAIAGIHATYPGGIDKLAKHWPAERRSALRQGGIALALRQSEESFRAKFHADLRR